MGDGEREGHISSCWRNGRKDVNAHLGSFLTAWSSIYTELSSPYLTFPLLQVLVLFFSFLLLLPFCLCLPM